MRSLLAIRSATAISGLALLAGLSLMLTANGVGLPGIGLLVLGSLLGLVAVAAAAQKPVSEDGGRGARVHPSRNGASAVGAAMVIGLVLVVASGGPDVAGLTIVLTGLVGGAVLVTPGVASTLRRFTWPALGVALLGAAIVALVRLGVGSLAAGSVWLLAALIGAGAGGLLILADALGAGQQRERPDRSSWSLISRAGRRRPSTVLRAVAGALMVLWATGFGIAFAVSHSVGHPVLIAVSALGVTIASVIVIGTPLLVTALAGRQRRAAERTRERERQRISAHLHDSVLQTLALVQRRAADPDAVARLAHRQEVSLRNWMAGETELAPGSLAAALRAVTIEVEDEADASIDLSMVGDRPIEPRDEALMAATREALRNAARHARGSPISVYAEVMDAMVEVYVSDEGPGFVPGEVPETRRGVRDAILARMEAAGGSAEVLAEPGHGTEVMLRLPAA